MKKVFKEMFLRCIARGLFHRRSSKLGRYIFCAGSGGRGKEDRVEIMNMVICIVCICLCELLHMLSPSPQQQHYYISVPEVVVSGVLWLLSFIRSVFRSLSPRVVTLSSRVFFAALLACLSRPVINLLLSHLNRTRDCNTQINIVHTHTHIYIYPRYLPSSNRSLRLIYSRTSRFLRLVFSPWGCVSNSFSIRSLSRPTFATGNLPWRR